MPITPKQRFVPFARFRRTLDAMYAHVDDTISELPVAPVAQQTEAAKPITLQTGPITRPVAGLPAA